MSNIVCAYCHIKGHHIKFCQELAEKNRRKKDGNGSFQTVGFQNPSPLVVRIPAVKPTNTTSMKMKSNAFADLYSSEEEEEGEIVDDVRMSVIQERRSDSSSPDLSEEEDTEITSNQPWSRSGIKGVRIPIFQQIREVSCEEMDNDYVNPIVQNFLNEIRSYNSKYDGMSWAEIDCLSECE